ncbi:TetR/AcrR family transcriptional regulator [Actinokineospora auranticolor]|uniref:AcrR family transcriptional regulator n=1 Tax=Actinokineospora auranticolor TaxID=155976 RepID=A0A2S6GCM8_9PSEU|nr:TetR/AcrR family transcriptional regulator [Actinokineospora auranticolor]PPK62744.1 AcrR family transcriptional regulator [Actinokineospora auranticolor]
MLDQHPTRKQAAILEAATTTFLDNGFRGTSMDAVARVADVSKQTVYQHFGDKERLFVEMVRRAVNAVADAVSAGIGQLGSGDDLTADLHAFATRQLTAVLQPRVLALRRLVTAEACRFPELGQAFFDQGPGRTMTGLTARFAELAHDGRLDLDDPSTAASDFNWLVMAAPVNEAMLLGRTAFPAEDIALVANRAVATFMRAYGPRP